VTFYIVQGFEYYKFFVPQIKKILRHKLLCFLEYIEFEERYGNRKKIEWGRIISKLIHIVTIVVVYLEPHKDIIVLPLDQVKKLFHIDQTQHPQELEILVSLRIDWKEKFYLV